MVFLTGWGGSPGGATSQELGVYLTGATEAPVGGLGDADMQMPKQSYIVCRVDVAVVDYLCRNHLGIVATQWFFFRKKIHPETWGKS